MIYLDAILFLGSGIVGTAHHWYWTGQSAMKMALAAMFTEDQWVKPEKYIRVAFFGLNAGLALMVILSLFPGGVLQLWDVLNNGYWHARSHAI